MTREPSTRQSRRTFLARAGAAVGAAGLTSLAGCAALEGDIEFGASAATVPQATLDQTGYQKHRTTQPVEEREFTAAGQSKTVKVTNIITEYDKAIDLSLLGLGRYQAAVFATLATPKVEVLGKTFNPVGEMSTDDLANLIQERYDSISLGAKDSEWDATIAGQTTTVARYPASANLIAAGMKVNLWLHLSEAVEAGEDFVVTFGAYPQRLDEADEMDALTAAVQHD